MLLYSWVFLFFGRALSSIALSAGRGAYYFDGGTGERGMGEQPTENV